MARRLDRYRRPFHFLPHVFSKYLTARRTRPALSGVLMTAPLHTNGRTLGMKEANIYFDLTSEWSLRKNCV